VGDNVGTIQGNGLGLSIVKRATDLLNGEIELTSTEGKGQSFW
jgi:signal transduction histidine kinase